MISIPSVNHNPLNLQDESKALEEAITAILAEQGSPDNGIREFIASIRNLEHDERSLSEVARHIFPGKRNVNERDRLAGSLFQYRQIAIQKARKEMLAS